MKKVLFSVLAFTMLISGLVFAEKVLVSSNQFVKEIYHGDEEGDEACCKSERVEPFAFSLAQR